MTKFSLRVSLYGFVLLVMVAAAISLSARYWLEWGETEASLPLMAMGFIGGGFAAGIVMAKLVRRVAFLEGLAVLLLFSAGSFAFSTVAGSPWDGDVAFANIAVFIFLNMKRGNVFQV
jgi:hypothetical protein